MRTARSSSRLGGGSPPDTPGADPPRDQAHPPVNRMTNRCKNITLPQTSFAGGKNPFLFTVSKSSLIAVTSVNGGSVIRWTAEGWTGPETITLQYRMW